MTVHIRPAGSNDKFYGPHRDLAICGKFIVASALRALQAREEEFPEDLKEKISRTGDTLVDTVFEGYKLPAEVYPTFSDAMRRFGYTAMDDKAREIVEREIGVAFLHYLFHAMRDAASLDPLWGEEDREIVKEMTDRVLIDKVKIWRIILKRVVRYIWALIKKSP